MAITQLSVYLANEPGSLAAAIKAISQAGINIRALSLADTRDFGILRLIVSDLAKTKEALTERAIATETPVIAVEMSDRAGALSDVLEILGSKGINIEYVYAFTATKADSAYVVLRVNDTEEAEAILTANGMNTLSDTDLKEML